MERRLAPAQVLPLTRLAGLILACLVVVALEITGRPAGLDPAVFMPIVILVGVAVGGLSGGALAALVGGPYLVLYYAEATAAGMPGGTSRVVGALAAAAFAAWIATMLRDRIEAQRTRATIHVDQMDLLAAFTTRLANEPNETQAAALVQGTAELLEADMAVLTLLDPPSGRHFVRAAHGGGGSAVGVEVLPGVGITGQAIRERRMIITDGEPNVGSVIGLRRRLSGRSSTQQMAALAGLQAGRVIATLTVGRSNGTPFAAPDRELLKQLGPLLTLAMAGSLARSEVDEASPRDPLTGLYNHAYLEAAVEQLIALRRRTAPEARPPLSVVMFDIDSFGLLNERHGRPLGDQVLRAVATLLRQRFRASDIVARVGADAFLVVLNGADAEIASEAAAQIRRQVRELNLANNQGEPVVISISAGCALYRDGDQTESVFRSVEAALDTARWSGPGGVVSI